MNDEVHRKRVLILQSIQKFQIERQGLSPTVRELATICNISSTFVVMYHIKWLTKRGYLLREPIISRGIIGVTDEGENFIQTYEERNMTNDQLRKHIRSARNATK